MLNSTPNIPPVDSDALYVLYNTEDGQILHTHRVITLKGGRKPSHDEILNRLWEHVNNLHKEAKQETFKVAVVDPKELKQGVSYRMDLKNLKLVETPRMNEL